MDTQGSLTHIVKIFKFGGVGGCRATKWPRARGWCRGLGLKDRSRVKEQRGGGLGQGGGEIAWFKGALVLGPKVNGYF